MKYTIAISALAAGAAAVGERAIRQYSAAKPAVDAVGFPRKIEWNYANCDVDASQGRHHQGEPLRRRPETPGHRVCNRGARSLCRHPRTYRDDRVAQEGARGAGRILQRHAADVLRSRAAQRHDQCVKHQRHRDPRRFVLAVRIFAERRCIRKFGTRQQ